MVTVTVSHLNNGISCVVFLGNTIYIHYDYLFSYLIMLKNYLKGMKQ